MPTQIVKSLCHDSVYTLHNIKVLIKSIDYETDSNDKIKQPVTLELIKL